MKTSSKILILIFGILLLAAVLIALHYVVHFIRVIDQISTSFSSVNSSDMATVTAGALQALSTFLAGVLAVIGGGSAILGITLQLSEQRKQAADKRHEDRLALAEALGVMAEEIIDVMNIKTGLIKEAKQNLPSTPPRGLFSKSKRAAYRHDIKDYLAAVQTGVIQRLSDIPLIELARLDRKIAITVVGIESYCRRLNAAANEYHINCDGPVPPNARDVFEQMSIHVEHCTKAAFELKNVTSIWLERNQPKATPR
ncbi:MAG: hypothetical protein KBC46_02745 [Ferrovibrio sp.]|nr:hypothetical protein [Ferrovibrio sp.]